MEFVFRNEILDWIVWYGVFQVTENTGFSGTNFDAGGFESASNAVIAKAAFFGRFGFWIEEAAAVGASLDAEAAADAIIGIDQYGAVGGVKGGADGTSLGAGGVFTKVAQLGNEE